MGVAANIIAKYIERFRWIGWIGLAVSSPIIGAIAGTDPRGLKRGLMLLPASGVLMILVTLALLK